jgi:hypothetical protein
MTNLWSLPLSQDRATMAVLPLDRCGGVRAIPIQLKMHLEIKR